ncbi:MAG: galactokinase [Chthoniobacteraceae bacterium]
MQSIIAHAPGRVELLGNHTDYNEGLVLSAAIDRGVTVHGGPRTDGRVSLTSLALDKRVTVPVHDFEKQKEEDWANYVLGVMRVFAAHGFPMGGFAMEIVSDLPIGAGLSSSAAIEVATATFLRKIFHWDIEPLQLAKLCRQAENEFVGVNCGLLDQVSSVFGKKNCAIYLDCRQETVETIPFPGEVALLIAHSGVKHALVDGEYNERRERCFSAAKKLGARVLRDVTSGELEASRDKLTALEYRRAAHVVGEIERVNQGIEFLRTGNARGFGELMFASHESSRTNFENSIPELDVLVHIAREDDAVHGSRLTGGGFGGATVSLIQASEAHRIASKIEKEYKEKTGLECKTYLCEIDDGAR